MNVQVWQYVSEDNWLIDDVLQKKFDDCDDSTFNEILTAMGFDNRSETQFEGFVEIDIYSSLNDTDGWLIQIGNWDYEFYGLVHVKCLPDLLAFMSKHANLLRS